MVTVLNLTDGNHIMDFPKKRSTFTPKEQDPLSHRIIEKRRRDRMNNCLADLSRLIPPDYMKKGRGRIEKTEIIEMAIKHLKYLQERANCAEQRENGPISAEHFRLGFQECLSELMRYLVEGKSLFPRDVLCVQLVNHLQHYCENMMKGDVINKPRCNIDSNSSSSGSSSNYMSQNQLTGSNDMHKEQQLDMNINDRLLQHSNIYGEEKSTVSTNNDMKHSRLAPECVNESPEEIIDGPQDIFPEQNVSLLPLASDNGFSGLKYAEGNADEGGGCTRIEFSQNVSSDVPNNLETDCQPDQDIRMTNQFSPLPSVYHYHCESTLRNIRKGDSSQLGDSGLSSTQGENENIHSYKFKNNIKQRFSQSQSTDYLSSSPSDGMTNSNLFNRNDHSFTRRDQYAVNGKLSYKKRKNVNEHQPRHLNNCYGNNHYKDQMSSSETNSSENITSVSQNSVYRSKKVPQASDMASERASTHNEYLQMGQHTQPNIRHGKLYNHTEKDNFSKFLGVGVPIFALHAKGSFYVPMNVDYDCLVPFLGPHDLLDATSHQTNVSLHPVTISVNFQPMFSNNKQVSIRTKSERKDWQ